MFGVFPILFFIVFFFIFGMIIAQMIRGVKQWNKNNNSPVLSVEAKVIAKRPEVSVYHHAAGNNAMHTHSHTTYYATFQVESGDRMELEIPSGEYGYLIEGDVGKLTFQGTRFKSFERK